jgi:hypothetical protein
VGGVTREELDRQYRARRRELGVRILTAPVERERVRRQRQKQLRRVTGR